MTPAESINRLPGSTDAECESGHKLRVRKMPGGIVMIATYNREHDWWEYAGAHGAFCPECGGEIK